MNIGGAGENRIRAETYIQQDAEQQTAILTVLVHAMQCKPQVNGRWNPDLYRVNFEVLNVISFSSLAFPVFA
jgi:hypothetical protein